MRSDVAPLGTLMFPHRLAGSALRFDADSHPQSLSRSVLPFPVSDFCIAFLPRSGVLSRHDTDVQVTPPGLAPPSASHGGWRDRCRSRGLGPSGRRSWQPMRAVAPAKSIARLTSSLVNTSEVMCQKLCIARFTRRGCQTQAPQFPVDKRAESA